MDQRWVWILAWVFFLAGWASTQENPSPGKRMILQIDGLSCSFCAYGLEKKLNKLEGVERLEIQLNEGKVILWLRPQSSLSREELVQKVKEAGFTLRNLKMETEGDSVAVTRHFRMQVEGIRCEACEKTMIEALSHLGCTREVQINRKHQEVSLICESGKMDAATLKQSLENIGFRVKTIEEKAMPKE